MNSRKGKSKTLNEDMGVASWISPDGERIHVPEPSHSEYVLKNPEEFNLTSQELENISKVNKYLVSQGWLRVTGTRDEINIQGREEYISKNMSSIKRTANRYVVDIVDENGDMERNVTLNFKEFKNKKFKKDRRRSKVSRFREIVREEVRSVLSEYNYEELK